MPRFVPFFSASTPLSRGVLLPYEGCKAGFLSSIHAIVGYLSLPSVHLITGPYPCLSLSETPSFRLFLLNVPMPFLLVAGAR